MRDEGFFSRSVRYDTNQPGAATLARGLRPDLICVKTFADGPHHYG